MVPVLDQRERDVIGLALMAAGVFLGFVLYGGWDGGHAGHGVAVGLGWALGGARLLAPIAIFAGGGALLLRPVLPAVRPLRTGSLCLFAGVTLALAAGTLGVTSGAHTGHGAWSSRICRDTAAWSDRRCMRAQTAWSRASACRYWWCSCC